MLVRWYTAKKAVITRGGASFLISAHKGAGCFFRFHQEYYSHTFGRVIQNEISAFRESLRGKAGRPLSAITAMMVK